MCRTNSGFTLVELVLVLALIGILATISAPRFFTGSVFVERGFFDDTLSAIRYAQKLAVTTGCTVQVSIAGGYTLNQRATSCTTGGFSQAVINPAEDQPGYSNSAPSGISIAASPVSVFTFDALGVASNDITISIGASRQIIVVAATGFVYGTQ